MGKINLNKYFNDKNNDNIYYINENDWLKNYIYTTNQEHKEENIEDELILKYFSPIKKQNKNEYKILSNINDHLSIIKNSEKNEIIYLLRRLDIIEYLKSKTTINIDNYKITQSLKKCGFENDKINHILNKSRKYYEGYLVKLV